MSEGKAEFRVQVAGEDRTATLGRDLVGQAQGRRDANLERLLAGEMTLLSLCEAQSMPDYLERHLRLLRVRTSVDPAFFVVPPARPGFAGRCIFQLRRFLFKLLRYQFEWLTFRQNLINDQLSYEVQFEHEDRRLELAELKRRVEVLEQARGAQRPAEGVGAQ